MRFLTIRFWLWLISNVLGHLVSLGIILLLALAVNWSSVSQKVITTSSDADLRSLAPLIVIALTDGIVVGLLQLVVLRHYISKASFVSWILYTAVGSICAWLAGLLMGVGVFFIAGPYGGLIVAGGIAGAIVGSAQSRILQRNSYELYSPTSTSWTASNALAGVIAVFIAGGLVGNWTGVTWSLLNGGLEGWLVSVAVAAVLYSIPTGYCLSKWAYQAA